MTHSSVLSLLVANPVPPLLGGIIAIDTKKGVLVRLENLSISDVSEDKDSDAKATEPLPQPEEATPEPNPENPPAPEESAPKEALEGDSKEEEAVTEISEDKECIPDDKTLATAPRDSIVW